MLSVFVADMPIFGLCPAHDDFYLVVCNDCNQVVKPQAFQSHYGKYLIILKSLLEGKR